jgi:hypothetical protein
MQWPVREGTGYPKPRQRSPAPAAIVQRSPSSVLTTQRVRRGPLGGLEICAATAAAVKRRAELHQYRCRGVASLQRSTGKRAGLASNDRTTEAAILAASCGVIVAGRLARPPSSDALHQPPIIAAPMANTVATTIRLRPLIYGRGGPQQTVDA